MTNPPPTDYRINICVTISDVGEQPLPEQPLMSEVIRIGPMNLMLICEIMGQFQLRIRELKRIIEMVDRNG